MKWLFGGYPLINEPWFSKIRGWHYIHLHSGSSNPHLRWLNMSQLADFGWWNLHFRGSKPRILVCRIHQFGYWKSNPQLFRLNQQLLGISSPSVLVKSVQSPTFGSYFCVIHPPAAGSLLHRSRCLRRCTWPSPRTATCRSWWRAWSGWRRHVSWRLGRKGGMTKPSTNRWNGRWFIVV